MAFGTAQGAAGSDATSFIGTAGVDTINLINLSTAAWLGAQAADDVIGFEDSSGNARGYSLFGGQGQDRLFVSDNATALADSFINLNRDRDELQLLDISNSTIYGGQGDDSLITGVLRSVRLNANKDDDTIQTAGASQSSIFGGQGSDAINILGTYGESVIQGDADNDTLSISGNAELTATTINGNDGNDTINATSVASFSSSTLFGGSGNDSVNGSTASTGLFISGDTGEDALIASAHNDSVLGGDGDDNLVGNAGADSLIGGRGDDFFIYNSNDVGFGEVIDGGAAGLNGNTILVATSTGFGNLATPTILTAGNIQNIRITDGQIGTFTSPQLSNQAISINKTGAGYGTLDIDVTSNTAADFTELTFTAKGAGSAFTTGWLYTVDIDVENGVNNSDVTGTTVNDVINGNSLADTLKGDGGNDTITGGSGADDLHGDIGNDNFYYTDNTQLRIDQRVIGGDGIDTIVFTTAIDTLTGGSPQGNNFHADFSEVRSTEAITLFGASRVNLGDQLPVAGITTINTGTDDTTLRYDNTVLGTITVNTAQLADNKTLALTQFGAPGPGNWFDVNNLKGDIDAQNLQGAIRVTAADGNGFNIVSVGGNAGDTISGGNGADTVTGAIGADQLTGGDGSDSFRISANGQSLTTSTITAVNLANADLITDFREAHNDLVSITAGLGSGGANLVFGGNVATLSNDFANNSAYIVTLNASGTAGANGTAGNPALLILNTSGGVIDLATQGANNDLGNSGLGLLAGLQIYQLAGQAGINYGTLSGDDFNFASA